MKKYVKPDLELKAVAASKGIAVSGLEGWLTGNNLSDVNITTTELYMTQS